MKNFHELRKIRPDLAEMYLGYYKKMSKEAFLEAVSGDILDLVAMEERVQFFMSYCTNMSYTTYPIETIKTLVNDKQQQEEIEFCKTLLEDYDNPQDLYDYIKELANQF